MKISSKENRTRQVKRAGNEGQKKKKERKKRKKTKRHSADAVVEYPSSACMLACVLDGLHGHVFEADAVNKTQARKTKAVAVL